MGVLRVLSHHGDDRFEWNQSAVLVGDEEAQAAIKEAERIFAEQRARLDSGAGDAGQVGGAH